VAWRLYPHHFHISSCLNHEFLRRISRLRHQYAVGMPIIIIIIITNNNNYYIPDQSPLDRKSLSRLIWSWVDLSSVIATAAESQTLHLRKTSLERPYPPPADTHFITLPAVQGLCNVRVSVRPSRRSTSAACCSLGAGGRYCRAAAVGSVILERLNTRLNRDSSE